MMMMMIRGHAEAAFCKLNKPICKTFFFFIFYSKKKKAWGWDLNPTVKGHSPI